MTSLGLLACLLTLSAAFGVINARTLRLPNTTGVLVIALLASLVLVLVDPLIPAVDLQAWSREVLGTIDLPKALLNGALSFLLFAGALQVDLSHLWARKLSVLALALVGTLLAVVLFGGAMWLVFPLLGLAVPLVWCIVLGAILAPTDPVSVVGMLRRLAWCIDRAMVLRHRVKMIDAVADAVGNDRRLIGFRHCRTSRVARRRGLCDASTEGEHGPDDAKTGCRPHPATCCAEQMNDAIEPLPHSNTPSQVPARVGQAPAQVRSWFDTALAAALPAFDGTLSGARQRAEAYARRAKAQNTRRAYVSGVRAWCAWCDRHALPCLPAHAGDVAAFLAAEHGRGRKVNTVELRRAAIRYLHFIAGCPVPTAEAQVAETMAGIRREAAACGDTPAKKAAATIAVLQQILAPLGIDLPGLRDRALLLVGFAGALRRGELAAIRVEHIEERTAGLRLFLPHSKGDRAGKGVTVALPRGSGPHCPARALQAWLLAAGITAGPVFRRLRRAKKRAGKDGEPPSPAYIVGAAAIEPRTVARIIQARAAAARLDGATMGGHSLKRGALTTAMDRGVHPTRLKQLGRHKSYAVLDEYLEMGDGFENHPLGGVL